MIAPAHVIAYDAQGFCDVQPRTALLQLRAFKYLNVQRTKLATITDSQLVGSDGNKRTCALAPAGHNDSQAIGVVVPQASRYAVATIRIAAIGG